MTVGKFTKSLLAVFLPARVAENYEENKMSPNNLGIIFGPTLIRPPFSNDVSMSCLIDSGYQSQLVEFLILNYERIFGMDDLPSSGLCERDDSLRRANVNEALSSKERDFDVSSEVGCGVGREFPDLLSHLFRSCFISLAPPYSHKKR